MGIYLGTKLIAGATVVPVGSILPFAGQFTPDGWLLCNGQEVSRTTYANLFNAIGETYGAGDGSTTFNLPNLTDKTVWGANSNVGTVKEAGLPNIEGTAKFYAAIESATGALYISATDQRKENSSSSSAVSDDLSIDASLSNSIYGNSDTVQPPALCLNMIIKY
jgi:microcystin-dependent protein